jgi:hypothetical protein
MAGMLVALASLVAVERRGPLRNRDLIVFAGRFRTAKISVFGMRRLSMRYPMAALVAPLVLAITAFAPSVIRAQASAASGVSATTIRLAALSRQRAAHWARTAPVVHCGPAPLTERPGSAAELTRPRVAPLEAAFLDAVRVRRTLAANASLGDR